MALCKGYCSINIMILPKQFDNGGWLLSIISINVACCFVLHCALKLVKCGLKIDKYSYSEIALKAFGPWGKRFVDVALACCQTSFTIAQISFTLEAFSSTFSRPPHEINMWWFAMGLIALYSPLAWVRNLQYFSFGYQIGMMMILFTTLLISLFSIIKYAEMGPIQPGFQAINTSKMWDTIGFSFYCFEGIGTVMPIMREAEEPEKFTRNLTYGMVTLSLYFSYFGLTCYNYFGHQDESIVINNLPATNLVVMITKMLFCVNLVFSYPLTIFPANRILESFIFSSKESSSVSRKWMINFSRFLMVVFACFCSINLQAILDQFLGISGAVLGIPIILIVPTLCHLRLCASTQREYTIDYAVITISVIVMGLCTFNGFKALFDDKGK